MNFCFCIYYQTLSWRCHHPQRAGQGLEDTPAGHWWTWWPHTASVSGLSNTWLDLYSLFVVFHTLIIQEVVWHEDTVAVGYSALLCGEHCGSCPPLCWYAASAFVFYDLCVPFNLGSGLPNVVYMTQCFPQWLSFPWYNVLSRTVKYFTPNVFSRGRLNIWMSSNLTQQTLALHLTVAWTSTQTGRHGLAVLLMCIALYCPAVHGNKSIPL